MSIEHGISVFNVTPIITDLLNYVTTTVNKGNDVVTLLNNIPTFNIPASMLSVLLPTGKKISIDVGSVSLSIGQSSMPLINDMSFNTYSLDLALCHDLDLGVFGSLLKMMMKAVQKLQDAVVSTIFDTLAKILEIFFNISDYTQDLWRWFKNNIVTPIVDTMGNVYNDMKKESLKNQKSVEQKKDTTGELDIKVTMYERVMTYINDFWEKKLQPFLRSVENALFDFVNYIDDIRISVMTSINSLIVKIQGMAPTIVCLCETCKYLTR